MAREILYDRLIGPTTATSGGDVTATTLSVSSETAPSNTVANYANLVIQVSGPGDTSPSTVGTCTDTEGSNYTLVKEVRFSTFALNIFSRLSATPNVTTTITTAHQPSKRRIILCDEWYNLGSLEKTTSAYASSASSTVDLDSFRIGHRDWLCYAVLALGGSAYSDYVSIPDDWNLLHDVGTNVGDGDDVRLVVCYQVANRRKKVDFTPRIPNARVWGSAMFSYKEKS